jgi:hypothetical protein
MSTRKVESTEASCVRRRMKATRVSELDLNWPELKQHLITSRFGFYNIGSNISMTSGLLTDMDAITIGWLERGQLIGERNEGIRSMVAKRVR